MTYVSSCRSTQRTITIDVMCRGRDHKTGEPGRRCPSQQPSEERRARNREASARCYQQHRAHASEIRAWVESIPPDQRVRAIRKRLAEPEIANSGKWSRGNAIGNAGRRKALERELAAAERAVQRERRRRAAQARKSNAA